ncbi:MAG: ChbG/HpnK family deacetylase [Caldilineaceae bacterium]
MTHLDSHHHVHRLPGIFDVYCAIARERSLPVRTHDRRMTQALRRRNIRCADQCLTEALRGQGHGRGAAPRRARRDPAQRAGRRARSHVSPSARSTTRCRP